MLLNLPETNFPRVVIIGGGFGGLELAKNLCGKEVQVIVIDKHNYHTFQPLLYQVATGGLEPDSIAIPFRKIFRKYSNLIFRMAEVEAVDTSNNILQTSIGEIKYDYLVIATGSATNFFGLKEIEQNAMPMKSIPEALNLRSLILQNFEKSLLVQDVDERNALMNMVVVGGGPTGVETSGALGELKKHVLPSDYPELDIRNMKIHLIEQSPKLLANMSEEASASSLDFLKKFDVQIWLNTGVKSYDGKNVFLDNDKILLSRTLIWTAGVKGNPINGLNASFSNRIKVDECNRVEGFNNIFAIGDVAAIINELYPKNHPMVAPVAIQQGKQLGKNLIRLFKKQTLQKFIYKDKGTMATVGRNKAVVDTRFLKTQGTLAWFIWMFVHLMSLVGFRNRLVVFVNWAWNYFSYDRGVRLIIRPFIKKRVE